MSRLRVLFGSLKARRRKGLIVFVTAGDPSLKKTEELVAAFEREGVDLVELGVPFSDPVADGPVIQASSLRSLERGTTLRSILASVRRIRRRASIPIVLMSYANPIHRYGVERFAKEAVASGVDGVILPDVPYDEGADFASAFRRSGLAWIQLMAPTSTARRRRGIGRASKGFVYYVSLTGVTGVRKQLSRNVAAQIRSAKSSLTQPLCVGFGVSTPAQARKIGRLSDGVIVGSAVVRELAAHPGWPAARFAERVIRPFVRSLRGRG